MARPLHGLLFRHSRPFLMGPLDIYRVDCVGLRTLDWIQSALAPARSSGRRALEAVS